MTWSCSECGHKYSACMGDDEVPEICQCGGKVMTIDRDEIFARMSGHYLTSFLPPEWVDWDDDQVEEFFIEHAWEPLEDWPVDEVFSQISSVTDDVIRLLEEKMNGK